MSMPDEPTELYHDEGRQRLMNFVIKGSGTSTAGAGGSVSFDSEFQIVEGTGKKEFEGITGGGRFHVVMDAPGLCEEGHGSCFFEDMNSIGTSLVR